MVSMESAEINLPYPELNWDREIITASFFGDGITTFHTWQIDEGRLNNTTLTLCGFQQTFGETGRISVSSEQV